MGNDNDDPAASPDTHDGPGKRLFPVGIEVGIWLIEDDEQWVCVKSASKRHPLLLACG
jgi:hypothetical protein